MSPLASGASEPLRRSALYVPAGNPRALAKAPGLAADALVIDLEDAVAERAKALARRRMAECVSRRPADDAREWLVRVNAFGESAWREDLAAVRGLALSGLVVPKVESLEALDAAAAADLPLWVMIETPRAVLNALILAAHPRAVALMLGSADLGARLRLPYNSPQAGLRHARGQVVLAASACGLDAVDGICAAWRDVDALARSCRNARDLGFAGKSLVHPMQIPTANRCFSPSPDELRWARRTLDAWRSARRPGEAVASADGRLVERLHVEQAERLLGVAERIDDAERRRA